MLNKISQYLWCVVLFFVIQHAWAQSGTVNIQVAGVSMADVLEEVSRQCGIKFAYDDDAMKSVSVTLNAGPISPELFLKTLSEKYPVRYKLIDGTYVVFKVLAQSKAKQGIVSGVVCDQLTGEKLRYCRVVLNDLIGTFTNELGYFMATVPITTRIWLKVNHLAFAGKDTLINPSDGRLLNIGLQPLTYMLDEVLVTRPEKIILEHTVTEDRFVFNPQQTHSAPRMDENDLVNALTFIPGISFLYGKYSGISIRGGLPSENLVLLDGIPIFETGHLVGTVSSLNAKFVKQVFVSRGGFDARYGGRVSGLIEMTGKTGNTQYPNADISANLVNGNAFLAVPLGKKISVSGAFRTSYYDYWRNYMFDRLLVSSVVSADFSDNNSSSQLPEIRFRDANAKLSLRPTEKQEISVNYYYGDDYQQRDYDFTASQKLFRSQHADGTNWGASVNWGMQIGKRWFNKLNVGYSDLNRNGLAESGREKITKKGKDLSKFERDIDANLVRENRASWDSELRFRLVDHQFGAGWVTDEVNYNFEAERSEGNLPVDAFADSSSTQVIDVYYQQHWKLGRLLKIRGGARVDREQKTGKTFVQPRAGIYFTPDSALSFHYLTGMYNQYLSKIRKIDVFGNQDLVWMLPGANGLHFQESVHHVVGFDFEKGNFLINVEAYTKQTDGKFNLFAEKYKNKNITTIRYVPRYGDQKSSGIDFFIQHRWKNLTQMLGYSWSKSDERYDGFNQGEYFPAFDDQRHRLQYTGLINWKGWVFSAIWTYHSGSPVLLSSPGSTEFLWNRLSAYSQLDLGIVKKANYRHWHFEAGCSLLNTFDRLNPVSIDYYSNGDSGSVKTELNGISRTPVFFVNIRFE